MGAVLSERDCPVHWRSVYCRAAPDCLTTWRNQGFKRGIASALNWLSEVARQTGHTQVAGAYAREGLQISSNDRPGIARALRELGALAFERQELDKAHYLLTESCITFRAMGIPWVYERSRSLLLRLVGEPCPI